MSDFETKIEVLNQAKEKIRDYRYALLYYISETVLCMTEEIAEVNWNEILEAYFFDKKGQLHFFDDGTKLEAVRFVPNQAVYVEKSYVLMNKHRGVGKYIDVREYLSFDEDGQCYVAYTALSGVR